ncbi:MAG: hypothetical protein JSU87_06455 [Gemmatimonadota bacterium]|nr:MAG: hypothetical protein JSU87_06455 [Gemmatimonadota bacterium]
MTSLLEQLRGALPSQLQRAAVYERLGETDKAVAHYERFVELMRDCDPEFRPLLERAEERLAALSGAGAQ